MQLLCMPPHACMGGGLHTISRPCLLLPLLPSNTHEPFAVDALHALQHMLLLHPACRPAPAHPTWEWCRMSNTCRRSPLAHQPCPGCCTTCCTCCKAAWAPAVSACNLQQQWCTVAAVTVEPAHSGRQREMDEDMMVTRPHQQAATCCKIICHNTHVVLRGSCVKRSAKRRLPRTGTQLAGGGGGVAGSLYHHTADDCALTSQSHAPAAECEWRWVPCLPAPSIAFLVSWLSPAPACTAACTGGGCWQTWPTCS